jgi:hypothetical protein
LLLPCHSPAYPALMDPPQLPSHPVVTLHHQHQPASPSHSSFPIRHYESIALTHFFVHCLREYLPLYDVPTVLPLRQLSSSSRFLATTMRLVATKAIHDPCKTSEWKHAEHSFLSVAEGLVAKTTNTPTLDAVLGSAFMASYYISNDY